MLFALAYSWLRLFLDLVDVRLRVHDPEAELRLLRHQLRVVRRQVKRPQLNTADRTIMAALSQLVNRPALVGMLVQPETVLGWHRVRRAKDFGNTTSVADGLPSWRALRHGATTRRGTARWQMTIRGKLGSPLPIWPLLDSP